jgi:hypothetical protein
MALSYRVGDVLSNGRRVYGRLSMNFLGSHVVLLLGLFRASSAYDLCPCLIPILTLKAFTVP